MAKEYLKPSNRGFREPTDTQQMNSNIHNPPRTAQLGGLDKLREPHGYYKNALGVKKPGNTIAK